MTLSATGATQRWLLLVVCLCPAAASLLYAQPGESVQSRIRLLPAGIAFSQTRAGDIVQDDKGFVWVGTQFGLNRYDGFRVKQFFHNPEDPSSVACSYIRHLFKDRHGRLWISCDGSFDRYDPETESFRHVHFPENGAQSTPIITSLAEDTDGTLWLASARGGIHFNPQTGSATYLALHGAAGAPSEPESLLWIEKDLAHQWWALTGDGLVQFDRATGVVQQRIPLQGPLSSGSFHQDRWGMFWLIARYRLYRVDTNSHSIHEIRQIPNLRLKSPGPVNTMLEDADGDMWFGTDCGVIHLPHGVGAAERFSPRVGSSNSLPSDRVTVIAQDSSGDIWVGFHDVPPTVIQRNNSSAETLTYQPRSGSGLRSPLVTAVAELEPGKLLIGTSGATQVLNEATGKYDEPFPFLAKRDVFDVFRDRAGRIWLGSDLGIYRLRAGSKGAERLLPGEDVHRFLIDPGGGLWVLTHDKLMHVSDVNDSVSILAGAASGEEFHTVSRSPDGTLWIGGSLGIQQLNPRTGDVHRYPYMGGSDAGPGDPRVNSLHFDTRGRLWVGTQSGLNLFDEQTRRFARLAQPDEPGGQIISCILEDRAGKLWIGSNQGLLRFDPQTRSFVVYNSAFGVSPLDLSGWGACGKSMTSYFFGGFAGVARFVPEEITRHPAIPHVLLTNLRIGDQPIPIGSHSPLKRSITQTTRLDLAHTQNSITLEFSALEFRSTAAERFRYQMEGLDEGWIPVPAGQHSLSFANLAAKTYRLHLQVISPEGGPQDPGVTLVLAIAKPWWATWWMNCLYLSSLIAAAWLAYRARIQRLLAIFNARTEGRLRERTALARELHDTLLQDLQGLILRLCSLSVRMPEEDPVRSQLDSAIRRAQLSLVRGRDAIQQMRTAPMRMADLPEAFRELAHDSHHLREAEVQVQALTGLESSKDYDVHEIYQIGKEAICNALQHARASKVKVLLACIEGGFRLTVADDGIGLPPAVLSGALVPGHWGVHGMRERTQRLRGTLTYTQPVDGGTVLDLHIPDPQWSEPAVRSWLGRFFRSTATRSPE